MKFGRRFPRRQSLEWTSFYVDYNGLKTLSKAACIEADGDWRAVLEALDRDVDKVEQFYTTQLRAILRQKSELFDRYQIARDPAQGTFSLSAHLEDWEALRRSLLTISGDLVQVQQYGKLNRAAVSRILCKVGRSSQANNLEATRCRNKTDQLAFTHQTQASKTLQMLWRVAQWLLNSYPKQDQQTPIPAIAPSLRESQKTSRDPKSLMELEPCAWDTQSEISKSPETLLLRDGAGNTPLHLAVVTGTAAGTRSLLETYIQSKASSEGNAADTRFQSILGELLPLAVRSGNQNTVRLLLQHKVNVNHRTNSGETPLYLASQYGYDEIVGTLLGVKDTHAALEIYESSRKWTPLFIACVEGHLSITRLLLAAGADSLRLDRFGWTAKEHAAYRGYLSLAKLIEVPNVSECLPSPDPTMAVRSPPYLPGSRGINPILPPEWANGGLQNGEKTHVLVTLGSPNTRHIGEAVAIDAHTDVSDTIYAIEIRLMGATASSDTRGRLQLPLVEDMINDPWHFMTENPEETKLVFSIFAVNNDGDNQVITGSAVALLQSLKHSLARNREGLARYYTIPILSKNTLEYFGTITFGLVTVKPSPPRKHVPRVAKGGFWKEGGPTQVVGHRGSGANSAAQTHLQLGENTIQSYLSAAKLGATAVEFDVQLTKDLVPVIFHDFLVMEAGGDTPLYTLRLNQFQHLSEAQAPKSDLPSMAEARYTERGVRLGGSRPRSRSKSVGAYDESRCQDLADRIKHTESAMAGDHKGNLRGDSIQGVFPTFESMFTDLPETTAFNVEMKYPMLWEAEDRNMDHFAPEINAYVDIVLSTIDRLAGRRSITFSSFSPEVCILLTLKQQDYPVLFLSKAGSIPVGDVRCSGLQQSVRFAKFWNLAGIVILSDPLVMCPRLIKHAKNTGLKMCSYGPLNNRPECAKTQADGGLDVIIVDEVKLISMTLPNSRPL
ncbi:MAG: hypothetical protein Q9222_002581 [Ikaeria aurantiellina]